jgi:dephospho-CoA kinase
MGKTTVADMFRKMGVPVFDADRTVHELLAKGGRAVDAVNRLFPGVVHDGAVDRGMVASRVFGDGEALLRLEAILHPLVQAEQASFLERTRRHHQRLVVLDIPLLFETHGEKACDAVAVVSAPPFVQRQRLLRRPDMTEQRLRRVLARQMPDAEKRRRADFVIRTGQGLALTRRNVRAIVEILRGDGPYLCRKTRGRGRASAKRGQSSAR